MRLAATFGRLVIGIAPTLLSVKERKVIWARVTIFLQFYQYFPGFRFKWTSFRIECTSVCSLSRSRFNASSHSTWTRFGIELDTATKGGPSKGPPPPLTSATSIQQVSGPTAPTGDANHPWGCACQSVCRCAPHMDGDGTAHA